MCEPDILSLFGFFSTHTVKQSHTNDKMELSFSQFPWYSLYSLSSWPYAIFTVRKDGVTRMGAIRMGFDRSSDSERERDGGEERENRESGSRNIIRERERRTTLMKYAAVCLQGVRLFMCESFFRLRRLFRTYVRVQLLI